MKTILLVDDRPANRAVTRILLNHSGYRTIEAPNGEEGLVAARLKKPDLIIADVLMPHMDGYEFVRQLHTDGDPAVATIPVIFHTASFLEPESIRLAASCGVACVLSKPIEPEEFLKDVATVLGEAHEPAPPAKENGESFQSEHVRLLTDKLLHKVAELEKLNHELELRVAERTYELAQANIALQAESEKHHRTISDLREALENIHTLSGLLPICSGCKNIRTDTGYWQQLETYIEQHSEATFSHGICPDCLQRLYPEVAADVLKGAT